MKKKWIEKWNDWKASLTVVHYIFFVFVFVVFAIITFLFGFVYIMPVIFIFSLFYVSKQAQGEKIVMTWEHEKNVEAYRELQRKKEIIETHLEQKNDLEAKLKLEEVHKEMRALEDKVAEYGASLAEPEEQKEKK